MHQLMCFMSVYNISGIIMQCMCAVWQLSLKDIKPYFKYLTLITHVVCCMCFVENICYTLLMCIVSKWFVCFTVLLSINHKARFALFWLSLTFLFSNEICKQLSCKTRQHRHIAQKSHPIWSQLNICYNMIMMMMELFASI